MFKSLKSLNFYPYLNDEFSPSQIDVLHSLDGIFYGIEKNPFSNKHQDMLAEYVRSLSDMQKKKLMNVIRSIMPTSIFMVKCSLSRVFNVLKWSRRSWLKFSKVPYRHK